MAEKADCYHVWVFATGGTVAYRWRVCYQKKQTADAAVRRWKEFQGRDGRRPNGNACGYMVLKCRGAEGECHCHCRRQLRVVEDDDD